MSRRGRTIAASVLACSCAALEPDPLPPRGEVLVLVDTDLPVPLVVARLRIDISTEDGRWIASRDDVRPDPRDWPTSFSVYNDDEARAKTLLVRLRAYPDARVVPYTGAARLEGAATPASEPDPTLAVDRTIRVPLVFGSRGRMRVVLRGECLGKEDCDPSSPPVEPVMDREVPSVVGSFAAAPCEGFPTLPERACIPGGAFVFGDAFFRPTDTTGDIRIEARPERVVVLSRFAIDRDEVTVERFRQALARGFVPPTAVAANEVDGPPAGTPPDACTWSAAPRGREAYPLSCVTWDTARAFCKFEGGDLPTEAEWEYTALAAGRRAKATYVWGEDAPTCAKAVFGRSSLRPDCTELSEGLPPGDAPNEDVTPLGVRNLTGSLEEHVRDDHAPFTADCWTRAPVRDPVCELPPPPECVLDRDSLACRSAGGIVKSTRGASWYDTASGLRLVDRTGSQRISRTADALLGFRCVYPAP